MDLEPLAGTLELRQKYQGCQTIVRHHAYTFIHTKGQHRVIIPWEKMREQGGNPHTWMEYREHAKLYIDSKLSSALRWQCYLCQCSPNMMICLNDHNYKLFI